MGLPPGQQTQPRLRGNEARIRQPAAPTQGRGTLLLPDRNPAPRRRHLPHHGAPRARRGDHSREVRRRLRRVLPPLLRGRRPIPLPRRPLGVFLLYIASIVGVRVYMAAQISTFNRTLPRGVRLSFMRLGGRFPELRAKAIACVYAVVIVGFFLICIMSGINWSRPPRPDGRRASARQPTGGLAGAPKLRPGLVPSAGRRL